MIETLVSFARWLGFVRIMLIIIIVLAVALALVYTRMGKYAVKN